MSLFLFLLGLERMKFQDILFGSQNQSSKFILIQDDKNVSSSLILNEFIKHNIAMKNKVYIFSLESESIMRLSEDTVNYHSYDARSWLDMETAQEQTSKSKPNHIQVLKEIQNKLTKDTKDSKYVVIVDSLAIIELLYPDASYKTLYELIFNTVTGNQSLEVICVLHTDVLLSSSSILMKYEQLATTNLILRKTNGIAEMVIRYRKPSGKVSESVQQICIDENEKIVTKEVKTDQDITRGPSDNADWINKEVTFKLALEDKEIQARSELILPYIKTSKQINCAEIIYEPDASDDLDEEDPDEDLDF